MGKILNLIILLLLIYPEIYAIDKKKEAKNDSIFRIISGAPAFGVVIPMHADMIYHINDFSYGTALSYSLINYKKGSWQEQLNFPEIGIGLLYNTYGNSQVYGYGVSVYPFMQSTIYRSRHFSFRWKVATGIGFINKPYHLENNYFNEALGSNVNVFVGLGLLARYRITSHWSLSGNLSFNHLSNGSSKQPNSGINTFTGGVGLGYYFNPAAEPDYQKVKLPRTNNRELLFALSYGQSQTSFFNPNRYPSVTLSVDHLWWRTAKTAWGAGVDWLYYGAAPYAYGTFSQVNEEAVDTYSAIDKMYGCAYVSFNRAINRTRIYLQLGTYLLYNIKPDQPIYPKFGLNHFLTRNTYIKFGLKAKFFAAEFLEFGIGYRINYSEKKHTSKPESKI